MNMMILEKKLLETTVGRVLFNQHIPVEVGFVNQLLTKKSLREIIGNIIKWTNVPKTAKFLDDIKTAWFPYGIPRWTCPSISMT